MRVKYSFSCATSSSGLPRSVTEVKPRMSENSTVISRRAPPSSASSGCRHQLRVDVLRHVSAEQPLTFRFSAPSTK